MFERSDEPKENCPQFKKVTVALTEKGYEPTSLKLAKGVGLIRIRNNTFEDQTLYLPLLLSKNGG